MEQNKLPVFEYCTLDEACEFIGNGCTKERLWKWRELGIIDICLLFDDNLFIDDTTEFEMPVGSIIDKTLRNIHAVNIGLSTIIPVQPMPGVDYDVFIKPGWRNDGPAVRHEASPYGIWKISNSTSNLYLDEDSYIFKNNTLKRSDKLIKITPISNGDFLLFNDTKTAINEDDISVFISKDDIDNRCTFVILPKSINIITDNIGKALSLNKTNSEHKQDNENKHSERHALAREHQLACILNAVFQILENESDNYPKEMNERVKKLINAEWLYSYINNHNAKYDIKESAGVLSPRVRDIIRDVKLPPSEWKIIGGTKSKK
ncbi:hypothetical protein AID40_000075 [Salmonella enterica subsp. enterica serovar Louga]|nr:hypothetical protein [Salmonella enterica subsp. enterica]EDW2195407.1 hypothetical protein [Salmonella enterica subsp. enterica]EGI6150481.1 hypothetical protein [Salmonella enterica subsp. enterica serovar Louga]